MSDYGDHPSLAPARHQRTDVPAMRIGLGLALVGITLLLIAGLVAVLFPRALRDQPIAGPLHPFPASRLQQSPRADMAAFSAAQMRALAGVWWIDRARGIVHQPIDDAMRDLARDGIANWPAVPVDPRPRDATLRDGTPPSLGVIRAMQRNVTDGQQPNDSR